MVHHIYSEEYEVLKGLEEYFQPIYGENSRILILGTFPSVESKKVEFYYTNSRNKFWKVIAEIFECSDYNTVNLY